MQATKHEIRKNVESLLSVPVSLVDERVLAEYIRRARQGDDVYAYTGAKRPEQPAFWNIWDGETVDQQTGYRGIRIELGVEHGR
jgi:hypothetical protein